MARKYKRNFRRRRRYAKPPVPGWGGVAGRLFKVGQGYVSKGGLAYKALGLARKVADAVNVEYKFKDVNNVVNPDYNGSIVSPLTSITQGVAGNGNRIGDSLKVQRLTFRAFLSHNASDCQVRIIWYWDDQNKTSVPSDVLNSIGTAYAPLSAKTYDKRFQTKILYDKRFMLGPNAYPTKEVSFNMPINRHTNYDTGAATIETGALKLLIVSNLVTTNLPIVTYTYRISYTDN